MSNFFWGLLGMRKGVMAPETFTEDGEGAPMSNHFGPDGELFFLDRSANVNMSWDF